MKPIITLNNITKYFENGLSKRFAALSDINLEVRSGELLVVLGPSGSGKSTLLRIMAGLENSFSGERILGEGIEPNNFSFVFQQFALLPWLTVFENVALGLIAKGMPPHEQKQIVLKELELFRLKDSLHMYPKELSGGMRQRVGFARALAINPKIIFMDEPFSELDSFTAESLREELLKIWRERKLTVVMVTHLVEEALELADRIAVLTPSPGKIEKVIVNKLDRPRNKRSPDFFRLEDELYELIKP